MDRRGWWVGEGGYKGVEGGGEGSGCGREGC